MHSVRLALAVTAMTVAAAGGPSVPAQAQTAKAYEMEARTRPITRFRIGSNQIRFGDLEFAGGLEMNASSPHFGALSGIAFIEGQSRFLAVADTGFWLEGRIERDGQGRPVGLDGLVMTEMAGATQQPFRQKWQADVESVAIDGLSAWVAFEREHRIVRYRLDDDGPPQWRSSMRPPVPMHELRQNRGFEGIAIGPASSMLSGALVGVSEYSLDRNRNLMAFVAPAEGDPFEFSVLKTDEFSVTDADFLPDGDLVLLERRFNVGDGVAMRLRRIDDADIGEGTTVDGPILLEADLRYQIDNMEGLSITQDPDGVPRLTIVSDDNHSLLQRNLLIEFRLVSPRSAAADG